jgi:hypothetical protein
MALGKIWLKKWQSKKKKNKKKRLVVKGNTLQWNSTGNILYATRLDIKSKITEKDLSKT